MNSHLLIPAKEPTLLDKYRLLSSVEEVGQVIVHASLTGQANWELVRIWETTYLVDRSTGIQSKLVHASNIPLAPHWTPLSQGETMRFTLVFEALPRECTSFDFMEIVDEPGGFLIENIQRNHSDVYKIDLSSRP